VAEAIRATAELREDQVLPFLDDESEEAEAEEGRLLTALHRRRERDPKLAQQKKEQALRRNGSLACEACGFDFAATYGDRGRGFIECHHRRPLSELRGRQRTRLDDLALVCSNCH
jgi:5-methylcytosine-specific restriction enzyme A